MARGRSQNLQSLFLTTAEQHGSKSAIVVDNGESTSVITYSELATQSMSLSEKLRRAGVKNNEVVAVVCSSFDEVILAILGVLQVPACFMYFSPKDPEKRILQLLDRLQVSFVISTEGMSKAVAEMLKSCFKGTVTKLAPASCGKGAAFVIFHRQATLIPSTCVSSKIVPPLAYVVFTSGTTGIPKVVKVPHQCILPNVLHMRDIFKVSSSDVIFNASPLTFDPSIVEIFLALSCGATLISVSDEDKLVPARLVSALTKHKVTILQATPSFVSRIPLPLMKSSVLSKDTTLRILAFGGEPCPNLTTLAKWQGEKNTTEFFNLYGITEVSCWASYHPLGGNSATEHGVSLGRPLRETVLEVRDEGGDILTEGQGQLFIGSKTRVCFIDDEVYPGPCELVFRATGDFVEITPAGLMFVGRKDDQFKRFGKRFSLKEVTQALENFSEVSSCRAVLDKSQSPASLFAFYIPTIEVTQDEQIKITDECNHFRVRLKEFLPEHGLPDFIFRVHTYPVTSHGKVDVNTLKKWGDKCLKERIYSAEASIESLIKEILNIPLTCPLDRRKSFTELGGNSLQAVRLVDQLETYFIKTHSKLLDILLHHSLDKVFQHLSMKVLPFKGGRTGTSAVHECEDEFPSKRKLLHADTMNETRKMGIFDSSTSAIRGNEEFEVIETGLITGNNLDSKQKLSSENHKAGKERDSTHSNRESAISLKIPTFGGDDDEKDDAKQTQSLKRYQEHGGFPKTQDNDDIVKKLRREQPIDTSPNVTTATRGSVLEIYNRLSLDTSRTDKITLDVKWQVDLKKCIDASPLVVSSEGCHSVAFIGSHSGLFAAVDTVTGQRLWQVQLPDRIESSACLTPCKKMVAVGCYDCGVYFFDKSSGYLHWVFPTLGPVKSSPKPDDITGLVCVGSHDGCVYALNPLTKTCVWKVSEGGGSMFSSPCVNQQGDCVYVASLSGKLLCISKASGVVRWSYSCQKPIFSSPTTTSKFVIVGCVDGGVYTLTHSGKLVHKVMTAAPIFSSPCAVPFDGEDYILIGSHDGHLYCIAPHEDGVIRWKKRLGKHVYSTPSCLITNTAEHSFSKLTTSGPHTKLPDVESSSIQTDVKSLHPGIDGRVVNENTGSQKARECFICCCSTDGKLVIVEMKAGFEVASYQFPGEVFSSPVMTNFDHIIVGCRNDFVYRLSVA